MILGISTSFGILPFAAPLIAYVGPGAGLTAIGSLLALLGGILLALIGFVWYPLKRLLRSRPRTRPESEISHDCGEACEDSLTANEGVRGT